MARLGRYTSILFSFSPKEKKKKNKTPSVPYSSQCSQVTPKWFPVGANDLERDAIYHFHACFIKCNV